MQVLYYTIVMCHSIISTVHFDEGGLVEPRQVIIEKEVSQSQSEARPADQLIEQRTQIDHEEV